MPRTVKRWESLTCPAELTNGTSRRDFRLTNLDAQTGAAGPEGCRACGVPYPPSSPSASPSAYCLNLQAGVWSGSELQPVLDKDPSGRTYAATLSAPPLSQPPEQRQWAAFFLSVTFHGAAPTDGSSETKRHQHGTRRLAGNEEEEGAWRNSSECGAHPTGHPSLCVPVTRAGDITITTNVAVTPDFLPFSCSGEGCQGGELL